jgi:hypothetical protein
MMGGMPPRPPGMMPGEPLAAAGLCLCVCVCVCVCVYVVSLPGALPFLIAVYSRPLSLYPPPSPPPPSPSPSVVFAAGMMGGPPGMMMGGPPGMWHRD